MNEFFMWLTYIGLILVFAGIIGGLMNEFFMWLTYIGLILVFAGIIGGLITF